MTTVAKSTRSDTIFLPESLFNLLKLREGDTVKVVVEGQTLRVARLEAFLSLRGALADDESFDQAMKEIEQGWNEWTVSHLHRYRATDRLSQRSQPRRGSSRARCARVGLLCHRDYRL